MKNNTCVFNFWFGAAYGGILTAFALQELLKNKNLSVQLVDTKALNIKLHDVKYTFTKNFWKKYFSIINNSVNQLEKICKSSKFFITGSDQVFRPIYMQRKLEQFLLDFAKADKKKIAMAASFGVDKEWFLKENSDETIEHMKNSLKSFDFISVREKSGVEICKDVLGVEAEWIIDPVFIYNDWNRLLNNAAQTYENKIVSYVLDTNKEYEKAYKYLEKKYDTKIEITANSNISVENWLKSIKDCKLFVTDSFHGMCFAIIFNKPFICIANKSRGRARFDSICEMLGIENQCINSVDEIYKKDCIFKIDYEKVNQNIEKERQKGLEFLKKVLEAPCVKQEEKRAVREKYLEEMVCELEKQANLKYQIKKELWNLWLIIWYKYLPNPVKNLINIFRDEKNG